MSTEAWRFAVHVIKGRWFSVFASFLVMAGSGATYLFGTYSKEIKSTLGYDQTTLNLLGFFKDLSGVTGVLAGLIAEVTPTWFVLLLGSATNFAGYFMIWLAVTGKIAKPKVWQMCVYICIGANSQNFANTGALVTCVKNFPETRGVIVGLLKGFVGLSGAIMTQFYLAIYGNDSKSLILLVAWLPAALSVVFVYNIRTMKAERQPNELRVFYHFLYVSIVLAFYLMIINIVQRRVTMAKSAYVGSVTVVCAFLSLPLLIAIRQDWSQWQLLKSKQELEPPSEVTVERQPSEVAKNEEDNPRRSVLPMAFDKPDRGEDHTILQALTSIDMLILFAATFCGCGTGLAAIDNLGQIGESLGYPTTTIKTFVSLVSIWNFFGRVFSGFASEVLLVKYKMPRPLMMTLIILLSCIGHLLIAFPFPASLYIASILIGFSYGAQVPMLFAIISELFGLKYYSTLLNCGQAALPLGSYVFGVRITGKLYDREAMKELARRGMDRSAVKGLTCIGVECFRTSFVILSLAAFSGALVSLGLVVRTRRFYQGDIYKKFREANGQS